MNATKALTVREVNLTTWQTIQAIGPAMYTARFFNAANPEQAMVIMIKGHELGMGIGASFEFIQIVQGRPTLSPRGALALVINSGLLAGLKIKETDDACTVWMKRKGDPELEYEFTWTQADSERAGLVKPGGAHATYPKIMRKWRAVGFCIDFLFSDVCGGLKRADELGAVVDSSGDVIDVQASTPEATPAAIPEPPAPEVLTLQALVDRYGADRVMEAAGERIPATDEDLAAVRAKLESGNAA